MSSLVICKPVHNLSFSMHGQEALKWIQQDLEYTITDNVSPLSATLCALLTDTSSVTQIDININLSDWETLTKVSSHWPDTTRAIIARKANEMTIYSSAQEKIFWEELYSCLSN